MTCYYMHSNICHNRKYVSTVSEASRQEGVKLMNATLLLDVSNNQKTSHQKQKGNGKNKMVKKRTSPRKEHLQEN